MISRLILMSACQCRRRCFVQRHVYTGRCKLYACTPLALYFMKASKYSGDSRDAYAQRAKVRSVVNAAKSRRHPHRLVVHTTNMLKGSMSLSVRIILCGRGFLHNRENGRWLIH